jgi:hypothetical protein
MPSELNVLKIRPIDSINVSLSDNYKLKHKFIIIFIS